MQSRQRPTARVLTTFVSLSSVDKTVAREDYDECDVIQEQISSLEQKAEVARTLVRRPSNPNLL